MEYAEASFALNGAPGLVMHLYYPQRAVNFREYFQNCCERSVRPPAEPAVIEIEDAILSERYGCDCLFDLTGRRIDASCVEQYKEDGALSRWRAAPTLADLRTKVTIREPILFQSVLFGHWGHFLLESMSRAWASCLKPELAGLPSVFARGIRPDSIGGNHREILSLAGVRLLPAMDPPIRVRLSKCFVPSPSFALGGFAESRHLLTTHRVAERLLGVVKRDARAVYLSRSDVRSNRPQVGPIRNEKEFEAQLELHGVRIVHMQRHTLSEQIEIMNAHSVFIAPWGSALHNTLFSLRGREITTFVLFHDFNPRDFILVASIVGNTAYYMMTMTQPPDLTESKQVMIDIDAAIDYLRRQGVL